MQTSRSTMYILFIFHLVPHRLFWCVYIVFFFNIIFAVFNSPVLLWLHFDISLVLFLLTDCLWTSISAASIFPQDLVFTCPFLFQGEECRIIIRTDNTDNEIILLLKFFFHKRSKLVPNLATDIFIEIKLQQNRDNYVKMLRSNIRSIVDTNMAVKSILRDTFNTFVRDSSNSTVLEIPAHEVTRVLMEQYDWHPPS